MYKTIKSEKLTDFNHECNELAKEGYRPIGDVVISPGSTSAIIQQWYKQPDLTRME